MATAPSEALNQLFTLKNLMSFIQARINGHHICVTNQLSLHVTVGGVHSYSFTYTSHIYLIDWWASFIHTMAE